MSEPRRLYAPRLDATSDTLELDADAARHARVLRLAPGDRVVLFDGRGLEADAIVATSDASAIRCRIERVRAPAPSAARVVLVQCLPKGTKLDEIVRATTECGVAAIHLAVAERSIARPDPDRAGSRVERLAKVAREAARQSERADVPPVLAPAPLLDVARRAPPDAARLLASPRGGAPIDVALARSGPPPGEAWIVVGPEGGLAPSEEDALVAIGWSRARLAVPVLRVETAAPVLVARLVDALALPS